MLDAVSDSDAWPPRKVATGALVVFGVVGLYLLLYYFSTVLFLLMVGIVLAMSLNPIVQFLQRRGLPRGPASVVVYLAVGGLLVAVAVGGLPFVWQQAQALVEQLPHNYQQLRAYLMKVPSELVVRVAERLPSRLVVEKTAPPSAAATIDAVTQASNYVAMLLRGAYLAVAVVLLAFYWSVHEDRTVRSLLLLAPPGRRDGVRQLVDEIEAKIGAYLRGQGLLCMAMAAMTLAVYWLIGVPYALSLALLAGVLEAVPVFGPVLWSIPALLVALSVSASTALWVLVAVLVLQQIESNILVPRIMDRSVGVNAIVTLLAIAGFSALLGLPGAVLAIPMAAVIQLLLDRWIFRIEAADLAPPAGRDSVSLLRYQLHELLCDVQRLVRHKETVSTWRNDRLEESVEGLALDLDRALRAAEADRSLSQEQ